MIFFLLGVVLGTIGWFRISKKQIFHPPERDAIFKELGLSLSIPSNWRVVPREDHWDIHLYPPMGMVDDHLIINPIDGGLCRPELIGKYFEKEDYDLLNKMREEKFPWAKELADLSPFKSKLGDGYRTMITSRISKEGSVMDYCFLVNHKTVVFRFKVGNALEKDFKKIIAGAKPWTDRLIEFPESKYDVRNITLDTKKIKKNDVEGKLTTIYGTWEIKQVPSNGRVFYRPTAAAITGEGPDHLSAFDLETNKENVLVKTTREAELQVFPHPSKFKFFYTIKMDISPEEKFAVRFFDDVSGQKEELFFFPGDVFIENVIWRDEAGKILTLLRGDRAPIESIDQIYEYNMQTRENKLIAEYPDFSTDVFEQSFGSDQLSFAGKTSDGGVLFFMKGKQIWRFDVGQDRTRKVLDGTATFYSDVEWLDFDAKTHSFIGTRNHQEHGLIDVLQFDPFTGKMFESLGHSNNAQLLRKMGDKIFLINDSDQEILVFESKFSHVTKLKISGVFPSAFQWWEDQGLAVFDLTQDPDQGNIGISYNFTTGEIHRYEWLLEPDPPFGYWDAFIFGIFSR